MKKGLLLIFAVISSLAMNAQTATNFNCNDCSGNNHDLFTELDAGKVIIMCWVMPCGACIAPASNCATIAQSYVTSHPGRVKYYLIDDSGNTTCTTLDSWANNNAIVADANFSNSMISMTDYGVNGMPKIVVLGGGSAHTVFFNENNTFDYHELQGSVDDALAATGIADHNPTLSAISLFPNPARQGATVLNYTLTENADVTIDIYNTFGAKVKSVAVGNESTGKHEIALDLSAFSNGVYFISLVAGEASQAIKFIVAE
jgi:hypothetical protein